MFSVSRFLTPLCLTVCLAGCSAMDDPLGRVDLDLAATPTLYVDSSIYTGEIMVTVHPNINLEERPTALFVPLGLTQKLHDSAPVSHGISRQIWQQFLREETFSTLELADMEPPYRADLAVPLARRMGADMLVGGYITYYYDGGMNGDTRISVQLEVYDARNGDLLWSLAHAAELPYRAKKDFLVLETRSRMPIDPVGAVTARLGSDMARLLHMWTEPARFEEHRRAVRPFDSAFGRF